MQEASCSAQAPSGCNRRPHGTSGGPGGPRGATRVVRGSLCVEVVPGVLYSLRSFSLTWSYSHSHMCRGKYSCVGRRAWRQAAQSWSDACWTTARRTRCNTPAYGGEAPQREDSRYFLGLPQRGGLWARASTRSSDNTSAPCWLPQVQYHLKVYGSTFRSLLLVLLRRGVRCRRQRRRRGGWLVR